MSSQPECQRRRRQREQLGRKSAITLNIVFAPADVDAEILTVAPTRLPEDLFERGDTGLTLRMVGSRIHQYSDAPHTLGLLRARREWPRNGSAAEQ
jgi:hypothetical protein